MIIHYTAKEAADLKAIKADYNRQITNVKQLIKRLRPDDKGPDRSSLGPLPRMEDYCKVELDPEPNAHKFYTDEGFLNYVHAMEAYNKKFNKAYDEWEKAGSENWRSAREKLNDLEVKKDEAISAFITSCEDRRIDELKQKGPEAIYTDAIAQAEQYIKSRIERCKRDHRKYESFSSHDVRAINNGKDFLLDVENIIHDIKYNVINRHLEAADDIKAILDKVERIVEESKYTTRDEGELFEEVFRHETTEKKNVVTYPKNYVTTVDRISTKIFNGELVRPLNAKNTALWNVGLDGNKGKSFARVALDYTELLKSGVIKEMPDMNSEGFNVQDAIISLMVAGNYTQSYDMLYRAMTGKVKGKVTVSDEIRATIDAALDKLSARIIIKYQGKDSDGNQIEVDIDGPMVHFTRGKAYINGSLVDEAITIPKDPRFEPALYKWAKLNHNEIDTRDITLLDVPKLNNGKESSAVKMCLYRRIIRMRNEFDKVKKGKYELAENRRIIRYDYIYGALGLTDPNPDKRKSIKSKIDRCMKYWQEKGFISGYSHKRDKASGNAYYAVVVRFLTAKGLP